MAAQRHNVAFVVGSVLGGVIGAAAALWTAPQTGEELRDKLTSGVRTRSYPGRESTTVVMSASSSVPTTPLSSRVSSFVERAKAPVAGLKTSRSTSPSSAPFSNKVVSFVERATAPIVGVKLGQTANGSGPASNGNVTRIESVRQTTADAPPSDRVDSTGAALSTSSGQVTAVPSASPGTPGSNAGMTTERPDSSSGITPSQASPEIPQGVPGHVPTTEELVTPVTGAADDRDAVEDPAHSFTEFPEYKDTKRS